MKNIKRGGVLYLRKENRWDDKRTRKELKKRLLSAFRKWKKKENQ